MKLLYLLALIGASATLSQGQEVENDILNEHPPITMVSPEVVQHDPEMLASVEGVPDVADRDLLFGFGDKPTGPPRPTSIFQLHYYGPTPAIVKRIFANVSNILNSVITSRPSVEIKKHLVPRDQCRIATLPGLAFKPQTLYSIPLFIGAGKSDGVGGSVAHTSVCLSYQIDRYRRRTAVAAIFYDPADVNDEADPMQIQDIILHEAIHVLGFGSYWGHFLKKKSGKYWYAGRNAVSEYRALLPKDDANRINGLVPVQIDRRGGNRGIHWNSSVFGDELMTGDFRGERHIFSRLTAKALEDLGYSIDYNSRFVEYYTIPTAEEMENIVNGRDRNSYAEESESD